MINASILIIDDEPVYLELLKGLLLQEGYSNVITETNPLNVQTIMLTKNVDVIISDIYMPEMNGLDLLEVLTMNYPQVPVIMVTAVDDTAIAVKAIKLGAYEFITKPLNTDRLFITIKRALDQKLLTLERDTLRSNYNQNYNKQHLFPSIITKSPLMYKVLDLVNIFAATNETILITGETGTGKDVIAKNIHDLSPRVGKPYVVVNIASISQSLFESELFGYDKGAFTGAGKTNQGFFEAANGGTIFLDEIGELSKELQGKLLRVIQYGEIYRVGNPKPISLDIRIIAATNRDLMQAVHDKEFRADLYYRLNRGFIDLPPLRDRKGDIPILVNHFLNEGYITYAKEILGVTDEAMRKLENYSFPGNIRELENIVLNALAKTPHNTYIKDFPLPENRILEQIKAPILEEQNIIPLEDKLEEYIIEVYNFFNKNTIKTASALGMSERTLQRRLQKIRLNQNL